MKLIDSNSVYRRAELQHVQLNLNLNILVVIVLANCVLMFFRCLIYILPSIKGCRADLRGCGGTYVRVLRHTSFFLKLPVLLTAKYFRTDAAR